MTVHYLLFTPPGSTAALLLVLAALDNELVAALVFLPSPLPLDVAPGTLQVLASATGL